MKNLLFAGLAALCVCTSPLWLPTAQASAQGDEEEAAPPDPYALLEEANEEARKRQYKTAVPKYKQVLQLEPTTYPSVYYNLAEIRRFQSDCAEAILLYRRYLELSPGSKDKGTIEKAIKQCEGTTGPLVSLDIQISGAESADIALNGIPVGTGKGWKGTVRPGRWLLQVTAEDFEPHKVSIDVPPDGAVMDVPLKVKTFVGELELSVNQEGAEIYVDGQRIGVSPLKEPPKLSADKHFLEVKKAGYHPWVRNVVVPRNDSLVINIALEKIEAP